MINSLDVLEVFRCVFQSVNWVLTCVISLTQNIELQVQLENMKKELAEKDSLLMQAKCVFLW